MNQREKVSLECFRVWDLATEDILADFLRRKGEKIDSVAARQILKKLTKMGFIRIQEATPHLHYYGLTVKGMQRLGIVPLPPVGFSSG